MVLTGSIALIQPASAQQDVAPSYGADFSAEACTRIKTAVESKIRPPYCGTGSHLTMEQLRICYTMPAPLSPEAQRKLEQSGPKQKQTTEEARAMVRETWGQYGQSIKDIEVAYGCNLVDQRVASLAVHKVQTAMNDQLIHTGLFHDKELDIDKATESFVLSGKQAVQGGACTSLTPAMRAALHDTVTGLLR